MRKLGQPIRLAILIVYVAVLLAASKFALGSWIPPTSEKGLWFYSGLASLLLGNLLLEPFYTPPADAFSNAVAAVIALLAVNVWQPQHSGFDRFLWYVTIVYAILVILSSIFSIVLKDSSSLIRQRFAKSLSLFSATTGTPKLVFSVVYLFALVTYHRNDPREYLTIGGAWAVLVVLQPLELSAYLLKRWREIFRDLSLVDRVGEVVGHQVPNVVLVCQEDDAQVSFGDALVVRADDGKPGLAIALDHVGFADGCWLRALHLSILSEARTRLASLADLQDSSAAAVFRADINDWGTLLDTDMIWSKRTHLVGLVAPDSSISRLRIEIIRTDLDLSEGRLVEVQIGSKAVLYQIVNGLTREEILHQKNTRGYVRADAKKIGSWNEQQGRFDVVKWVPHPNAPVFLVDTVEVALEREAIGHFPGTDYRVAIDDVGSLVTHNTAILGILGIGKTYLAIELVERMIASGIKVICLDLTNQYAQQLSPFYNEPVEALRIQELQAVGPGGKTNFQKNVEEGGSVGNFKEKLREILAGFLNPETPDRLAIYNPAELEVWRQDSKPFKDRASMASLTPAQITRVFAETVLEILHAQGMTDDARCCLVFEEAHSLIPEWNAVASEGDKSATNGTAKAILQGRKYGLGCLVVTQRTANVTKSILNQCNTVFALRVFDATGMEFLRNYIGDDYSGVLSTLEDRHAVLFGRASSCRDPVLIRLNDRSDFIRVFRERTTGAEETRTSDAS